MGRDTRLQGVLVGAALLSLSMLVCAQGWKPQRPVELVVGCAPGCGPDNMARLMQHVFQQNRYLDVPLSIQNKANGIVGRHYVSQFEGNAHYVYAGDRGMLASAVMNRGGVQYTDLTPIAILFGEYIGVAVRDDSPITSGRDLIDRLKRDPSGHAFGIATAVGNSAHQSVAGPLKNGGVDIRKMRTVTFNSGALAIIALLGGHVDVVPASMGLWTSHMKAGAVRLIAVSAAERLPGFFSTIPTWREQGGDSVLLNWRGMFAPRGISHTQIAYWESTFQSFVDTPEWKAEMVTRSAVPAFRGSTAMKKYMEEEHVELGAVLAALGLLKN
jgi:putative tricarboxylic transport membrane protein